VLKQASGKDVCIATNEEVDKAFRDADEVIKKYLASHLVYILCSTLRVKLSM